MPRCRWLILNYHEISWEENLFLRPVGGTFSPDLFEEHVACLASAYDIVTPDEGRKRLSEGRRGRPLLTFWFDDGLKGVRRYALPILSRYGARAAISVNSALSLGDQSFWRFELAFLAGTRGPLHVRRYLASRGIMVPRGVPIRDWTLRNFTLQMRQALAEQFIAEASEDVRRSCMAMYDDFGGFRDLGNAGWAIANHTARHYPVSAVGQLSLLGPEFTECDECLRDRIGVESPYWVLPFDQSPDPGLDDAFDRMNERGRLVLVHVGNRANVGTNRADRLWRVSVPPVRGRELLRYLASIH